MADLTGLHLRKPEKVKWDDYPPGGGVRKRPQKPGRYYARVQALKDIKFDAKDGDLRFVNRATIQDADPERDDTVFDYVTNKPYKRGKRAGASRMGDFLLAVGVPEDELPQGEDQQEWAEAVERAAEGTFAFLLDWDAYDTDTEKSVAESADDFKEDPNHPGEKLPYIEVARPDGSIKRVAARQRIRFYIFANEEDE